MYARLGRIFFGALLGVTLAGATVAGQAQEHINPFSNGRKTMNTEMLFEFTMRLYFGAAIPGEGVCY